MRSEPLPGARLASRMVMVTVALPQPLLDLRDGDAAHREMRREAVPRVVPADLPQAARRLGSAPEIPRARHAHARWAIVQPAPRSIAPIATGTPRLLASVCNLGEQALRGERRRALRDRWRAFHDGRLHRMHLRCIRPALAPQPLPLPGQGHGDRLPRQVARSSRPAPPGAPAHPAGPLRRPGPVRRASLPSLSEAVGRLCQAALRRPRAGLRLSRPLHPSRRPLQPAPGQLRRSRRLLPHQARQDHHHPRRRAHAQVSPARLALALREDPPPRSRCRRQRQHQARNRSPLPAGSWPGRSHACPACPDSTHLAGPVPRPHRHRSTRLPGLRRPRHGEAHSAVCRPWLRRLDTS